MALLIASKSHETNPVDLQSCFTYLCLNNAYDLLEVESDILFTLDFCVEVPTSLDFLFLFFKIIKLRLQQSGLSFSKNLRRQLAHCREIAKKLCLYALADLKLSLIKPSLMAAISISYAFTKIEEQIDWQDFQIVMKIWEHITKQYLSGKNRSDVDSLAGYITKRLFSNPRRLQSFKL